ncbi:MAG: hypothetical protein COT18_00675 [Elusimicrobia bacterium CG08_land_8_20_14_0_20_59_10]|nr:MAG: hypothetical protein COT18_00675 [Elusimicrobia bacterium CG08_land_8_20_14_0_20_59_10]
MKKKPVIISLALTAAALLAGRAFDGEREMIIGAFSSLHAAAAAGRSPWPGYSPAGSPLLVELPGEGGSLLFSTGKPPAGFQPSPGGGEGLPVYFSTAQFQGPDFSVLLLDGEKVTRIRFTEGLELGFRTAVHEAFHFFQRDRFKIKDVWNMPSSISAETLADAYIERQLLFNALVQENWRDSLRSFAALRRSRYTAEKKDVREFEENRELTEGIATYVERESLPYLNGQRPEDGGAAGDLQKLFNVRLPYFMFSFYGSGLVQCLLLDRLGVDWKKDAQTGKPLFEILSGQIALGEKEVGAEAARVRASHGFRALVEKARGDLSSYERTLEYLADKHRVAAGGIRVVLKNIRLTSSLSSQGGIHYLGGRKLLIPEVKRFELSPSSLERLSLYGGSIIMELGPGPGENLAGDLDFVLKNAGDVIFKLDGKEFARRDGCGKFMKEISISSPYVDFWRAGHGRICFAGNKVGVAAE